MMRRASRGEIDMLVLFFSVRRGRAAQLLQIRNDGAALPGIGETHEHDAPRHLGHGVGEELVEGCRIPGEPALLERLGVREARVAGRRPSKDVRETGPLTATIVDRVTESALLLEDGLALRGLAGDRGRWLVGGAARNGAEHQRAKEMSHSAWVAPCLT